MHTGECVRVDDRLRGVAVHIVRVSSVAAPGGALVSSSVKDLGAGSGLAFEDPGERELKASPTAGSSAESSSNPPAKRFGLHAGPIRLRFWATLSTFGPSADWRFRQSIEDVNAR